MKIELLGIEKYFGEHHVLKDVSLTIKSGQIFGFLGRNGAGKTTSLRIIMDVFKPSGGQILANGEAFMRQDYKIGYLPEERGMYAKTSVKDQLLYFAMLRGADHKQALASVDYWTKRFEIDQYLNRKLETLSKGNQQKVQITQAFLNEPDILILDEPFSGLDPVNSKIFQDALMEYIDENRIIIFSSHQMSYVESFCDDIAIIDDGEIILAGSLGAIKKEWGSNRLRIRFRNQDEAEALMSSWALPFAMNKQDMILDLQDRSKENLLRDLMNQGIEISAFMDYEPSLQEIFVTKVGENHA